MLLSFSYIYFRKALFNPFNVMIYLFSCWLFREGFDEYFCPFVEQYTSLYQNLNTGCCMDNPSIFSQLIINFFGSDRGWDGWMASLMRWTCVWVGSWSWWWTGKPGVLQSMGSQRVRHDWSWTEPASSGQWAIQMNKTKFDLQNVFEQGFECLQGKTHSLFISICPIVFQRELLM